MRTRNALERLAAAAPAVELPADAGEDRILARILASPRPAAGRRRPLTLALAAVAALAAAAVVGVIELGHDSRPLALTGAELQIAGYQFRTPAGFKASTSPCAPASARGFAAAASADGGCVEAAYAITVDAYVPPSSEAVAVGRYQGYFLAHAPGDGCHQTPLTPERCSSGQADAAGDMALYVSLPKEAGDQHWVDLVLFAQGLTKGQLIAVAVSGLPG